MRNSLLRLVVMSSLVWCGCTPGTDGDGGTTGFTKCGAATRGYWANGTDQSAVVAKGASKTIANATIASTSVTSSAEDSSTWGLNAAVLAENGGHITLTCSTVTTTSAGANGVFTYGSGASVTLTSVTIDCAGDGAHGVDATGGAALSLTDVDITTAGPHGAAVAIDRGGATVTINGGTMKTSGQDSPPLFSAGSISVSGATLAGAGSEAAVIEGAHSISLINTTLSGAKKWGVMIYQATSGDPPGNRGSFTMSGGALSAGVGPLFYVTNTIGEIQLSGVALTATSGAFLYASAGNWGTRGANGGTAKITAEAEEISGDVMADAISSVALTLKNHSTLTGAIDPGNTAGTVMMTLDASSTWNVTADSYLTCLDSAGRSGTQLVNVIGNGHTVRYQASSCSALRGASYTLSKGGTLGPGN